MRSRLLQPPFYGLLNISTRFRFAITLVGDEVLQHLLATLDCVSTQAAFNLGNLIVILVADGAVSDFAGTA